MCVAALCAASVLGTLFPGPAAANELVRPTSNVPSVPGEVVVRFDPDFPSASRGAARAAVDGRRAASLGIPGLELVELDGTSVADAVEELEARSDVLYAEPNYLVTALATPNDPYFSSQWGLHDAANVDIDAPQAWDVTTGSGDSIVAVVDTGVAWDHPDLAANVWVNPGESGANATNGLDDDNNGYVDDVRGWDLVDDDNEPMDVSGHGTHVAGTIAATGNNGRGVTGVGWNTKILPLRILNASGSGTSADVARSFHYAADAGARVVNASFGTVSHSQAVADAVAAHPEVLFVAAAGNAGTNNDEAPLWPCNLPNVNVICVTAVGRDNAPPSFANVGPTSVDIAAPGTSILSTGPNLDYHLGETFEVDVLSRWGTGGTASWGPAPGANGFGYSDSPDGPYAANANSWLATGAAIETGDVHACALTYDLNMDTAYPDLLSVETSSNGTSWDRVNAYYGSTEGSWLDMAEDLPSVGPRLHVRFRLESDGRSQRDGVTIDNVSLRCALKEYGDNYFYSSGTSMATPHVAGTAALLFSAMPAATAASVKTAMFETTTDVPALSGLIVTGGRVNAAAAVAHLLGIPVEPPPVAPTPTATVEPLPTLTPDPDPMTPDPDPITPDPGPTASPEPEIVDHTRSLATRLLRGPRLRGVISVDDGYKLCKKGARVVIRRKGRVVKRVTTGSRGRFRVKVPSLRGRYKTVVKPSTPIEGHTCSKAVAFSRFR